jgi:hypothetical protein
MSREEKIERLIKTAKSELLIEIDEAKGLAIEKKRDVLLRSSQLAGYGEVPNLPQYVSVLFILYHGRYFQALPKDHSLAVCGVADVIWKEKRPVFDATSGKAAARETIPGYKEACSSSYSHSVYDFLRGHSKRGMLILGRSGYRFAKEFRRNAVLDKWAEKHGAKK